VVYTVQNTSVTLMPTLVYTVPYTSITISQYTYNHTVFCNGKHCTVDFSYNVVYYSMQIVSFSMIMRSIVKPYSTSMTKKIVVYTVMLNTTE
jgi:hypothetical protein